MKARLVATAALATATLAMTSVSLPTPDGASYTPPSSRASVRTVVDTGQIVRVNWFSDWQTCIWGIGVPTALALKNPKAAKDIAKNLLRSRSYSPRVVAACYRFIQS